jgi:hypothetical protein
MYLLYNQLMVTYAFVELFLHAAEHSLRGVYLCFFLLCVSLCVEFLSDIQEVRSQFLQLTACDAHH